jgi:hypothetical protein
MMTAVSSDLSASIPGLCTTVDTLCDKPETVPTMPTPLALAPIIPSRKYIKSGRIEGPYIYRTSPQEWALFHDFEKSGHSGSSNLAKPPVLLTQIRSFWLKIVPQGFEEMPKSGPSNPANHAFSSARGPYWGLFIYAELLSYYILIRAGPTAGDYGPKYYG